jgi:alpha-glucoside transport system permease protein
MTVPGTIPGAVREGRGARLHRHLTAVPTVVLWLLVAIWTVPTLGLLVSSFRAETAVKRTGWWTVVSNPQLTLDNYRSVFSTAGTDAPNMWQHFLNSVAIALPATIIPIALAAFAAYAFAWMHFRGRDWLFVAFVALLAVPLQVTLVPVLRLFRETGLSGQFLAVWLAGTGYALPFSVYLLRNAMAEVPREVLESAWIDGAGHGRTFLHLILPMTAPALGALSIFQFLFVWNDLLVNLVILGTANPQNLPLTVLVANLSNSLGSNWHYLMAAAFLTALLPLAVFFLFQRSFIRGITAGSVKG